MINAGIFKNIRSNVSREISTDKFSIGQIIALVIGAIIALGVILGIIVGILYLLFLGIVFVVGGISVTAAAAITSFGFLRFLVSLWVIKWIASYIKATLSTKKVSFTDDSED